jgi:hypothetical protein
VNCLNAKEAAIANGQWQLVVCVIVFDLKGRVENDLMIN